jgi:CheY-like chemotaxis protein
MNRELRALVVDDDKAIRTLVKLVLQRAGFEVVTAENGFEAIERLADRDFDVVTLDLMMPGLDGFGVIDHLADFEPERLNRVIVLTAFHQVALDSRVYAVLPKPFDVDALLEVVLRRVGGDVELPLESATYEGLGTWN